MKNVSNFDNFPPFAESGSRTMDTEGAKYATGFVAADTLPAEWANYLFHGASKGVTDLNSAVSSIWSENVNVLSEAGITPDATSSTQLVSAIRSLINSAILSAHPVGSYYMSREPTDPSTIFGGTWTRVENGYIWTKGNSSPAAASDTPVGMIAPYGGATAPSDWLLCNGSAVGRTTYSELFAVIGTSFGPGDGSTTFNLPDLREATTKGVGLTGKSNDHYDSDGVALGEFVEDRVQQHIHSFGDVDGQVGLSDYSAYYKGSALSNGTGSKYHTTNNSGRSGNTTEVKAVGVNYIIKAKMVAMPSDEPYCWRRTA